MRLTAIDTNLTACNSDVNPRYVAVREKYGSADQADKLALLAIILLLADVSPIYSSGLPQGNVF